MKVSSHQIWQAIVAEFHSIFFHSFSTGRHPVFFSKYRSPWVRLQSNLSKNLEQREQYFTSLTSSSGDAPNDAHAINKAPPNDAVEPKPPPGGHLMMLLRPRHRWISLMIPLSPSRSCCHLMMPLSSSLRPSPGPLWGIFVYPSFRRSHLPDGTFSLQRTEYYLYDWLPYFLAPRVLAHNCIPAPRIWRLSAFLYIVDTYSSINYAYASSTASFWGRENDLIQWGQMIDSKSHHWSQTRF